MIDIHSHIIPGVDDGPDAMSVSLEMLDISWKDGIRVMAATPHAFSGLSHYPGFPHLFARFTELREAAKKAGLPIELAFGTENYFDTRLQEYLNLYRKYVSLNGGDYFLLEFPPDFVFPGARRFVYSVMTDGFIPIICHPERNSEFRRNPVLLYQLMQDGALSQVTASSLSGEFGGEAKSAALHFLRHNLVSVIASDCHHSERRVPGMSFLFKDQKEIDRQLLMVLTEDAPRAILNNQAPPETGPLRDPGKTSFFGFGKKNY